jgi:DNA adenine methylase Dam
MNRCKTPLRYPGGKSKAIKKLFANFPPLMQYDEYREPFLGGGSVAIEVTKNKPGMKIWVNDLYWPLYNFWIHLRDRGEELSEALRETKLNYNTPDKARVLFDQCKKELTDKDTTSFEKAVNFWIVNKCSYSGLTESSTFSAGPSDSNFSLTGIENLKYYSKLIKNWKITNESYEKLLEPMSNGFVYLDPPYAISSGLYGKRGSHHKNFDHHLFAQHCRDHFDHYHMAISYNDDEAVRQLYPEWNHHVFPLTYTLRADRSNYRKNQPTRNELLLTNY